MKKSPARRPLAEVEAELAIARQALAPITNESRIVLNHAAQLRAIIERTRAQVVTAFYVDRGAAQYADEGRVWAVLRDDEAVRIHTQARAALEAIEASAEYLDALENVQPLLDRVAELEDESKEARHRKALAGQALEDARKAAAERALAEAEKAPEVVAAAQAAAAL